MYVAQTSHIYRRESVSPPLLRAAYVPSAQEARPSLPPLANNQSQDADALRRSIILLRNVLAWCVSCEKGHNDGGTFFTTSYMPPALGPPHL